MELIELNPQRDHLQTMIIDDVLKHLKSENDTEKALRIALLLAINLLQFEDDFPASDFVEAMLAHFEPLIGHFDQDGLHPLCGGYNVALCTDENGNLKIALPTEYIRYVGGSALDESTMPPESPETP
jgi:hypothetical protein